MKTIAEAIDRLGMRETLEKNLERAFVLAKKNPPFADLVSQLNLPNKILWKYTSLLENSALEYSHCQACQGLTACQNEITGFAYLPKVKDNDLLFQYQACRYQQQQEANHQYLQKMFLSHVPVAIAEASMENIFMTDKKRFAIIEWLYQFIEDYQSNPQQKGLYLYGSFGCGKTYLIAAMFHELAKKGMKSAIIFWPEFLSDLKQSFQNDDFKSQLQQIKKVPLLLIDDIGAESTTAWSRDEILCPLLQYRMQEQLPTFFTSNLDFPALEQHFSMSRDGLEVVKARRIMERIKQLTVSKELISQNLRK